MPRTSLARFLALVVLAVATSCDSLTGKKDASFTMGLSDNDVTVNQGKTDTILITFTRKDFNKEITLNADGVPDGVSASFSPKLLDGALTQSLLLLTAAGTATAGAATITVRATAEGVTEQSGTIAITVGITGSFTMSAHGSPATAAQSGGAQVTVFVPRVGGHADNVSLTVTGAPSGVVAVLTPAATTGSSASLAISADGTVPVGAYTLKVKGTAQGSLADSVNVVLNVIAPPSTAVLTVPFCPSFAPVWFAYQNQGYAWQTLAAANAAYTFQATSKVAVAYAFVIQNVNTNETDIEVVWADRSELAGQSDRDCSGSKTVNGSVAGLSTGQSARVTMGAASTTPTTNTAFVLSSVADRALDLVATRGVITTTQNNLQLTPDRVLLQRNLNPVSGGTVGTLDFNAASFAPVATNLTLANTGAGELFNIGSTLWTATNTYGVIHSLQPTTTATSLYSVPAAQMQAGDKHELVVESYQSGFLSGRLTVAYLGALADRTETLAPALSAATLTALTSTPYARLRGQLPVQAEYPDVTRFIALQDFATGTPDRLVYLILTAGYLGGTPASSWDIVLPDFTGVSGFNSSWALTTSSPQFQAEGYSGSAAVLFGQVPVIGDVWRVAYRYDPNGNAVRSSLTRPPRLGPQYLRR